MSRLTLLTGITTRRVALTTMTTTGPVQSLEEARKARALELAEKYRQKSVEERLNGAVQADEAAATINLDNIQVLLLNIKKKLPPGLIPLAQHPDMPATAFGQYKPFIALDGAGQRKWVTESPSTGQFEIQPLPPALPSAGWIIVVMSAGQVEEWALKAQMELKKFLLNQTQQTILSKQELAAKLTAGGVGMSAEAEDVLTSPAPRFQHQPQPGKKKTKRR